MNVSSDKTVVLENKKLEYTPPAFEKRIIETENKFTQNPVRVDSSEKSQKSKEEFEKMAKEINKLSENKSVDISFDMDTDTGKNIVKFIDRNTKEVLKQFPSEEMLKITEQIDKFLARNGGTVPPGFLINERV